jgi:ubiquinone biosynthesis monooxygenase Coq7
MVDALIVSFDRALRTLSGIAQPARETPAANLPETPMSDDERRLAAGLMRVNHT